MIEYILGGDQPHVYLLPFKIWYVMDIPLSILVFGEASVHTWIPSLLVGVAGDLLAGFPHRKTDPD